MSISIDNTETSKIAPTQRTIGIGIPCAGMDEIFGYSAFCPVCGRRVFDLSNIPGTPFRVRLKCPHCRNIVRIPFPGGIDGIRA